jgi:hypothetical protein
LVLKLTMMPTLLRLLMRIKLPLSARLVPLVLRV